MDLVSIDSEAEAQQERINVAEDWDKNLKYVDDRNPPSTVYRPELRKSCDFFDLHKEIEKQEKERKRLEKEA